MQQNLLTLASFKAFVVCGDQTFGTKFPVPSTLLYKGSNVASNSYKMYIVCNVLEATTSKGLYILI